MTGVVGYTKFAYVPERNVVCNMLRTIVTNKYQDFKVLQDEILDLGISVLKSINSVSISIDATSGLNALIYGWIYNEECVNELNQAECLLQAYLRRGVNGFKDLNGSFCGILWSNRDKRIILVTDKLSTRPIYYALKDKELIFSTHARAILQYPGFLRKINEMAIVKFLMYGKIGIIGDDTFFNGVKTMPPASILVTTKDEYEIHQYWDLEYKEGKNFDAKKCAENLAKIFSRSINTLINRFNGNVALLLSGGLDSRSILAALNPIEERVTAITFGINRCTDINIAKKVASKFEVNHLVIEYDPEDLARYANYIVYVTDGQDIVSVSYIPYIIQKTAEYGSNIVMHGFALDNLLGGIFLRGEYFKIKDVKEFIYLLEKNWSLFSVNELRCILGIKLSSLINIAKNEFIKVAMMCKGDSFPNKANYFSARTRLRFISMGSVIIREFAEELLPAITDGALDIITKIPARERYNHKFHRKFLLRLSIKASKVPYGNILVPPILPHKLWRPVQGFFFIIDKIMKKMSNGRISLFTSYFDFDKILRESKEWRKLLWDLLVREDALVYRFGYLNRQCVLEIIKGHLRGKNNGLKLAYLMTLEIFLRTFFGDNTG